MITRAKFRCDVVSTIHTAHGRCLAVELYPVASGNPENKKFFEATPAGQIKMSIVAEETAKQFVPGQEYYVDFTPAQTVIPE